MGESEVRYEIKDYAKQIQLTFLYCNLAEQCNLWAILVIVSNSRTGCFIMWQNAFLYCLFCLKYTNSRKTSNVSSSLSALCALCASLEIGRNWKDFRDRFWSFSENAAKHEVRGLYTQLFIMYSGYIIIHIIVHTGK